MFVKLINGTPHIANMPDEEARQRGYKLAVFAQKPVAQTGSHAESYWTEEADTCSQHWNIVQDEDPDLDAAEAFEVIFGGDTE